MTYDEAKEVATLPCPTPNIGDCGHCVTCEARKFVEENPEWVRANAADAG